MSSLSLVANVVRKNFLFRVYKHYVIDSIIIVKKEGFKALVRKRGVKFLAIIFTYYLVRDTLIYIVIPFCIARGFF